MSHSTHLFVKKNVIQRVWKPCPVFFLLLSYGVPLHSNCTHHIYLGYLVQHECSVCLFSLNESVMNQSGTSEKPYIISLHITFKFMMLAFLPIIASHSASRGCLRAGVVRLPYQRLMHRGSWENSRFVPYWARAQLLVERKMGHDEGFLWSKFVMDDEHNWLAEVKGGNQKIGANHCSFKLMMDKSLSRFFHLIKCFIADDGGFQNPLTDSWENRQ